MKRLFVFLLFARTVGIVKGQSNSGRDPYITRSLSGQAIKNVEAHTSGGNIDVIGSSTGNNRLEVYVWPGNSRNGDNISKEE